MLAARDASHADKVVTLYSRQWGKLEAVAYGSRLAKSRLGGCMQPFSCVRVSLTADGVLATIKQCEIIHSFRELREDIMLVSYASLLAELVKELWPERQSDPAVYDTLLAAFGLLSRRNPRITALACGWQLVALAGFQPQWTHCLVCETTVENGAGFSVSQGGTLCLQCQEQPLPEFSSEMMILLRILLQLNWQQPGKFTVSSSALREMECLFENYVTYHLEKPLKSLAFIRQMACCQSMDRQAE